MEPQSQKRQDAQIALALGKAGATGQIAQAVLRIAAVLENRTQSVGTTGPNFTGVGTPIAVLSGTPITPTAGAPGNFQVSCSLGVVVASGTTVDFTLLRNGVAVTTLATGVHEAGGFCNWSATFNDPAGTGGPFTYAIRAQAIGGGNILGAIGSGSGSVEAQETF